MKNKLFLLPVLVFIFFSCDILRFSRFEVLSWTPGEGYFSEPEKIVISILFSKEPNKASVERNFTLTGDGSRIRGSFFWEGNKLIFTPLSPLEKNIEYTINVSADASDKDGLSMDEAFICNFTTRPDNTRPVLLSYFPAMYAQTDDPRMEISLEFSIPVPIRALYDHVSFSPSMTGFWRTENNSKLAIFTPSEPWMLNNRYEIRISASLTGSNGMNIGYDFLSIFITQTDYEIPYLLQVNRISKNGDFTLITTEENQGWEKEDKLHLIFSKPVDSVTVKNYINIEDGPPLVMETFPGFNTDFIFRLESIPVYESRFTLKIKPGIKDKAGNETKDEYIYRVLANGRLSKPPELAGLRIPMAPGNEIDKELEHFGIDSLYHIISISDENYPSGLSTGTWIELYFITAEGAAIDLFSVMEHFRVETSNNVITFSARQIKTSNFSVSLPQAGWEDYQRIEISGNLVNSINFGIINFQISPGLKDTYGNKNEKLLRISVIK